MKKNGIYIVLTILCLGVLFTYLRMDRQAKDLVAPKIQIDATPLIVLADDPDAVLMKGITATDDRDGDVTDSLLIENMTLCNGEGLVSVAYAAFDRAGNVTKVQREVQIADYTGPRFVLDQPLVFTENTGFDVLRLVRAEDQIDGDITQWIRAAMLDEDNVDGVDIQTIQFRVNNSLGDTEILELPVEIHSADKFHGSLKLKYYLVYLKVGDPFDPTDYPLTYTLGNRTLRFEQKLPEQFSLEINNPVDIQTPGVYSVTYTITYTESGYSYDGYSKLLVVVEE